MTDSGDRQVDDYAKSTSDWRQPITFWNRPLANSADELRDMRPHVGVLGAPWDGGSSYRPGARLGPRTVRSAAFSPSTHAFLHGARPLKEAMRVVDAGDALCRVGDQDGAFRAIRELVLSVLDAGARPLVIGGDHSISIASISSCAQRHGGEMGVIHLDAHVDTDDEIDGNPLSHGSVFRRLLEDGDIKGENLLQLGLRGMWPPRSQLEWASEQGVSWLSVEEVVDDGRLDDALNDLRAKVSDVYVTVDLDVLDPAFAPGVGVPEPGGLSTREVLKIVRRIAPLFTVVGADVVEFCPPFDLSDLTANAAMRILLELLACMSYSIDT